MVLLYGRAISKVSINCFVIFQLVRSTTGLAGSGFPDNDSCVLTGASASWVFFGWTRKNLAANSSFEFTLLVVIDPRLQDVFGARYCRVHSKWTTGKRQNEALSKNVPRTSDISSNFKENLAKTGLLEKFQKFQFSSEFLQGPKTVLWFSRRANRYNKVGTAFLSLSSSLKLMTLLFKQEQSSSAETTPRKGIFRHDWLPPCCFLLKANKLHFERRRLVEFRHSSRHK